MLFRSTFEKFVATCDLFLTPLIACIARLKTRKARRIFPDEVAYMIIGHAFGCSPTDAQFLHKLYVSQYAHYILEDVAKYLHSKAVIGYTKIHRTKEQLTSFQERFVERFNDATKNRLTLSSFPLFNISKLREEAFCKIVATQYDKGELVPSVKIASLLQASNDSQAVAANNKGNQRSDIENELFATDATTAKSCTNRQKRRATEARGFS